MYVFGSKNKDNKHKLIGMRVYFCDLIESIMLNSKKNTNDLTSICSTFEMYMATLVEGWRLGLVIKV